ncbi:hypothetical protein V5T82_04585 [Magnetovibrio sp. PR-2]|uniref:hypothetical protein n=1 Tax=Magnetovibrio sp. PR-2 TaxID=3120356 RepID=UPI002FCE58EA
MPEPFKNLFNVQLIEGLGGHLKRVHPPFDVKGFIAYCTNGLDALELKERSAHITDGLEQFLPQAFEAAVTVMIDSLDPQTDAPLDATDSTSTPDGVRGWAIMSMADYVARHGQENVSLSLNALKDMTSRFSSEFAIRPFLLSHPTETLKAMAKWQKDPNEHVRRLVSEGSRTRLPWGIQLKPFIADPAPVLKLLEGLKDDPSEYVRRSVANNLNDISKDNPDVAARTAQAWIKGADENRKRLIRHALRTLIKAGHPAALKALGYGKPKVRVETFSISTPRVQLGEAVDFEFTLASSTKNAQPLIIDYAIHHMRANGKTSPKVFKWKTVELKGGESLTISKRHNIKPVTTRKYYSGTHKVEVLVNGVSLGVAKFELDAD